MPVSPYTPNTDAPRQPKLLEHMRIHLRTQHHSIRTDPIYVDWVRCFILFHKKQETAGAGQWLAAQSFFTNTWLRRSQLYLRLRASGSQSGSTF